MSLSRLAATLLLCVPLPAAAHAILMESQPLSGAVVPDGPTHLVLRYNSRIDQARSRLELRRDGQAAAVLTLEPSSSDTLVADTPSLAAGAYVVRWQVLAVDGHITRGDVPITVHPASSVPAK